MLHRNPNKRPTFDQLMKEPFFADIDWDKLLKREIDPPSVLSMGRKSSDFGESGYEEDEETMLF